MNRVFSFSFGGLEMPPPFAVNKCLYLLYASRPEKRTTPPKISLGQKVVEATVITHYRTALAANNCRSQPYLPREILRHKTGFPKAYFWWVLKLDPEALHRL